MTEPRKSTTARKSAPRKTAAKPVEEALVAEETGTPADQPETTAETTTEAPASTVEARNEGGLLDLAEATGLLDPTGAGDQVADEARDEDTDTEATTARPGWYRAVIAVLCAIIVIGGVIIGLVVGHHAVAKANAETAQQVTTYLSGQGANVSAVDCASADTCTAIIQNQAYTVVVLTDVHGKKQYGVSAYAGSRTH